MYTSYLVDKELCIPLEEVLDSDVAGWGVITAFTAAIVLNLSAIIIGYLVHALPDCRYKQVDHWFLQILGLYNPNISPTGDNGTNPCDHDEPNQADPPTHPQDSPQEPPRSEKSADQNYNTPAKKKWTKALESLVLGMSDLQLFTGMALMIPTLLMTWGLHGLNESLSVYSFKVVSTLAYFSFITQLCSLAVVPGYFSDHKPLGYFRAVVMTIFLSSLVYLMIISESVTFRFNSNVSVKCALQNLHIVDTHRPGYTKVSDEAIIYFNLLVLTAIIGLGYYRRIRELFEPPQASTDNDLESDFWDWLGLEEFQSSFLLEIIWMVFYFVFGLANLCKFLIDKHADIGAIEPSFGQLVPIFLLAHPFLSALDLLLTSRRQAKRVSTTQQQDGPPAQRPTVILILVVFIYALVLVIWALMFADVISGAYALSGFACFYTLLNYGQKCWKYLKKVKEAPPEE